MGTIHIKQIKSFFKKKFNELIDLSDFEDRPKRDKEQSFLSRSVAAFAVKHLNEISFEEAANSITDGYGDNGIDAAYYNSLERTLYLVQSKWNTNGNGTIKKGDVHKFLKGLRDIINARYSKFNDKLQSKKSEIDKALLTGGSKIVIVIAHTGKQPLSDEIQEDIHELLREENNPTEVISLRVLDQGNIYTTISEGAQGKPIDSELVIFEWGQIKDPYFAVYGRISASDLDELWKNNYPKLFSPNIRMFLGETEVNDVIKGTLMKEPEKFWYFNNGVTALCDKVQKKPIGGSSRETGIFECKGLKIVNGAQTVGAIAEIGKKDPEKISDAYVPIKIISLEKSPEDFEKNVTRYNNTQNKIERRDFVALDPEQERLKTELLLDNIEYNYKSGEPSTGEKFQFSLGDATIARACSINDIDYAVQAKREIGKLWEDIDSAPYRRLFNAKVSGRQVWVLVQILRIIEEKLYEIKQSNTERKELFSVHGNRLVEHLVYQRLGEEIEQMDTFLSKSNEERISELTEIVFDELFEIVDELYPQRYLSSLVKNKTKCSEVKEKYLRGDFPQQMKLEL